MIKVDHIVKKFNKRGKKILDDVSFNVKDGEIVGFIGENGAGKTTLMKITTGLVIPTSGDIFYDDKKIGFKNLREIYKKVSVVLDGGRSLEWRVTVRDNFIYYAYLKNIPKESIIKNIEKYSKYFNIEDLLDKKVKDLSLGQKQIIAIISALVNDSKYIFLDEPTNGLDLDAKSKLIELLKQMKKEYKKSIVVTTHDLEFLLSVGDRCIVIDNGKMLKEVDLVNETYKSSYDYYKMQFYK